MALSILLHDTGGLTTSKFCLLSASLGADANGNSSDDINIDNTNNSAFPASGPLRTISVEGEEIAYTTKGSSTQFTTITRGVNNTNIVAHADNTNVTGVRRYALKADSFGVSIQKTPIQIAFPQDSPELLELGMFRPSITVSGTVDRDQATIPEKVVGPSKGNASDGDHETYYVPTQKQLEDFATDVVYDDSDTPIQIIVQTSSGVTYATYDVAISQARFDLAPGTEDRFSFSLSFVGKDRQES
jgi:hypothetical protein|tara:strand:+ start:1620 stop:2351 length:732 start_codon:yes stop_codon:yes gene_type:complete